MLINLKEVVLSSFLNNLYGSSFSAEIPSIVAFKFSPNTARQVLSIVVVPGYIIIFTTCKNAIL